MHEQKKSADITQAPAPRTSSGLASRQRDAFIQRGKVNIPFSMGNAQCSHVCIATGPQRTASTGATRGAIPATGAESERRSLSRDEQPKASSPGSRASVSAPGDSSSSSESESEDDNNNMMGMRGPRFKHFGKRSMYKPNIRNDEDDDDSPAFLPHGAPHENARQDLNATLRQSAEHHHQSHHRTEEPRPSITGRKNTNNNNVINHIKSSTTTESSASSAASFGVAISRSQTEHAEHARRRQAPAGLLSPQRTVPELASRGSRRSNASGKEISDGTPSMGSSFSDLDGKFGLNP